MQAEILGFVGFTQQETDVLSPRESATITEYLRALLAKASSDLTAVTSDLQFHLSDIDDPHKVGRSASFLESVYQVLYDYYIDITDTPMSYNDFKVMAKTPVWLDFVRRLIVDHNLFVLCRGTTGSVTLPVGLDTASADPNATPSTATASGISSIDSFLSQRGALGGWDTFSDGNTLGRPTDRIRPKFYTRRDMPLLVTSTDPKSDFRSLLDLDLSDDAFPITVGIRVGAGRTMTGNIAPTTGSIPLVASGTQGVSVINEDETIDQLGRSGVSLTNTDIVRVIADSSEIVLFYDPADMTASIKSTISGFSDIGTIPVPTGILWMTIDKTTITLAAQNLRDVQSSVTDISTAPLSLPKSISLLQSASERGEVVDILSLCIFAGISDTDLIHQQSAYL